MFAATHSKLRKAADGTGTQVATCMINKWMTKINGKEIYNTRGPPREGGKKKGKRGVRETERRSQFLPPPKAFVAKQKRIEKKKNQSSDQA